MKTKSHTVLKVIFISITLIASNVLFSQVTEEWVRRYNGTGNSGDKAYSIALSMTGICYVTGYSIGAGTTDIATIKYSSTGIEQWVQRFNGTGNNIDEGRAIATDNSGNVYITGLSMGLGTAEDYITLKYNSAGILQWAKSYNGPLGFSDIAAAIVIGASGNIYVTGKSGGSTGPDYATVKYNSSGVQIWAQRYNGPANQIDEASSIAIDASENIYITGFSNGDSTSRDITTIKYDAFGNSIWIQRYNGQGFGNDDGRAMFVDNAGNVYVTGSSQGAGSNYDYVTIKYNSAGMELWVQRYSGPGNNIDQANALAVDAFGNVYVTGYSLTNPNNYDCRTVKYNSSGNRLWVNTHSGFGDGFDEGSSLKTDAFGNVYVAGRSTGELTNLDYFTIKYDSSGAMKWLKQYNGPGGGSDEATSIAIDPSGNIFVTGGSSGDTTSSDYATIKYSQSIGINILSNEIPGDFLLSQNYPNPFNPDTKIKFQIPEPGSVKLILFDVLGREVLTLVDEKLQPGTYETDWHASNQPGGIYFYKLITESFVKTQKMVLLK